MKNKRSKLELAICMGNESPFMKSPLLRAWAQMHEVHGRVFAANGFHAISCKNGEVPYNEATRDFIHTVSHSFRNLPRFYFDIVKHHSGVDMIKLDETRTYDCMNLLEGVVPADKFPNNGLLASEKASLLVSIYASYVFYEHMKSKGKESEAQAHVERYKTLAANQPKSPIIENVLLLFPDFQEEVIRLMDLEEDNKPAS